MPIIIMLVQHSNVFQVTAFWRAYKQILYIKKELVERIKS